MANSVAVEQVDPGWLRSRNYDLTLIRSVALLALLSGFLVVVNPALFGVVLIADLWLLGYHHVVSTMTRLAFDRTSIRENRLLLFYLPPLVFGMTFLLAWQAGVWLIATVYLYWQWFHYTRQSWGVSQAYRRKCGGLVTEDPWFSKISFYLVPTYGILYRSWQSPDEFLFQELRVLPMPEILVDVVGIAALISTGVWAAERFIAWRKGRLARSHTYYMISHFVIFLVGYRLIEDITHGWLVINIWHNAQYILFVWLFNTNRFKRGIEPSSRFLSWLCQAPNKWQYLGVCIGISTAVYALIGVTVGGRFIAGLPFAVLIYQAINFHHYIVDSVIWKMRKKPLRVNLGLERS